MADTIFTLRPADRQCAVGGSGLKMSTVALPPGTTMRLPTPRRWRRIGMRKRQRRS